MSPGPRACLYGETSAVGGGRLGATSRTGAHTQILGGCKLDRGSVSWELNNRLNSDNQVSCLQNVSPLPHLGAKVEWG